MKIAFFTDTYHPQISGVVENVETSAKALRRLGHEVYIIAPKTPGYKTKDKYVLWVPSVKVKRNPEFRWVVPIPDRTMRTIIAQNFDIMHGHSGGPLCFLGLEIARMRKIPFIFTYHTLFNRYTHYIFNGKLVTPKMAEVGSRIFCNLSTHVIVPTQIVRKELRRYGYRKALSVIPGGIDLDKFSQIDRSFLRRKFKLANDITILIYVGRLGKEKNIDFLIKAFSEVDQKEKSVMFIVGDGPERKNLEHLASELGLAEKIIFTGFVPTKEVQHYYAGADIFLFASKTETQGLVVAEAMAAKLPVVVVEDGAFKGIVVDQQTGLVAANNLPSFVKKIELLISSQDLRKRLGSSAQKLISQEYSAEKQAEKLVSVYKKALVEKSTSRGLLENSIGSLIVFLRLNQNFNRFKSIMRFMNGQYY